MSETLEKVSGIEYLPIFPLPLVLLPNELLPLHIFEPKYRQMLKDIELKRNVFGVSRFEPADDFENRPLPNSVGCVAEVREVQPVPDERSNIVTTGLVRYRLLEYVDVGAPYLTAEVEFFEDDKENEDEIGPAADEVYELFNRIAKAAFKLSGNRGRLPEIPQAEPEPLSFLVTAAFNLDNELKYQLLELTSTLKRLEKLKSILEQSVGQMEESADIQKLASTNGHSNKKLDL
ncbi:MAG: LON peptidase substrate-binding domain-containing protein [Blastocatellia bacterium]|nr:LON peptidase substrate-binding domain-containing protein [Blastocatellia bacterium]